MEEIFSDGVGSITVVGTTVRVDFVSLSPTERDDRGQPKPVFRQRVVMSIEGFLRSAAKMQEALQGLSKMGATAQITPIHAAPQHTVDVIANPPAATASLDGSSRPLAAKPPFP